MLLFFLRYIYFVNFFLFIYYGIISCIDSVGMFSFMPRTQLVYIERKENINTSWVHLLNLKQTKNNTIVLFVDIETM